MREAKNSGLMKEAHLGQWFSIYVAVLRDITGSAICNKTGCNHLRLLEILSWVCVEM